jgi:putative tryptophan/tyrosine transport system substrate-binding protein
MQRREFITVLCGAAIAGPLAARAQQPVRVKRIGLMANLHLQPIESFRNRLRELGYIEGQNLIVEYRFAEGREDAIPTLPQNWLPVDLIVTWGTPAAFAAKAATTTIPIVLGGIGDAINTGLVSNLARPDADITGFIALNVELEEKRLELLKEVVPSLSRVAVLGNSLNPLNRVNLETAHRAAKILSVAIEGFEVRSSEEVRSALRALVEARPFLHPIRCSWASAGRLSMQWRRARFQRYIRSANTRRSAVSSLTAPIYPSCLGALPTTSIES